MLKDGRIGAGRLVRTEALGPAKPHLDIGAGQDRPTVCADRGSGPGKNAAQGVGAMATSIWIAKLLGPVLVVAAIPMVTSPGAVHALASDFLKSRALIYVTGVLVLLGGLSIVNTHNRWIADWPVIITAFGWAMVIGGAARVAVPGVVVKIGGAMLDRPFLTRTSGAVWALIGVFLTFEGYA
jgi:hypothetical protein